MRSRARYDTLVASLPHLAPPERTDRLPINRERLEARLRLLSAMHARELSAAVDFLEWQRRPPAATAAALQREWADLLASLCEPALRAVVAFHRDARTVLAALRRRGRGEDPAGPPPWAAGPWADALLRHWDEPDFRLGAVFPWLAPARAHLEAGEVAELERLLGDLEWRLLVRLAEAEPFGFPAVVAFRFQWGLLERRLARDRARSRARFEHLMQEVCGEHSPSPD